ncbi:hypothetical protein [Xenorhabdus bovienii]|uniref:hypothetical protein n=1 Tax=Xenorhabdus bovienii TaxID=40576 RepID=UPI0023B339A6|nr:hypothetical protein [Xenorhabdus bovienii]MDE9428167.1 hypothetical protein [Xenorhabdus bovienii]MDE9460209.1 hypothetical protein [Xenorhabdus bovienii]MDE9468457.1 hypothetical protein [Xenorhabdus bovienii]
MNKIKFIFITTITPFLSGCGELIDSQIDKYFPINPQYDSQSIIISSIPPNNTKTIIFAKYLSSKCSRMQLNSDFIPKGEKYRVREIEWDIKPNENDRFETKIPINGRGWCDWKLSTIKIGLEYNEKRFIDKSIQIGTGKMVVFHIENIEDKKNNKFKQNKQNNTINYTSILYPVYKEFKGEYTRVFFVKPNGEGEPKISLSKKMNGYIYYNPKLDETKITKIIIPKGKEPSRVEYPDGKVELNRDSIDYWKINNIPQWR